ncbi:hypothetical protein AM493_01925 [Flavobacterium akiainvivens]|uniref:DUF1905 domain-containing protein n=1 Tax=Flavobacterium akiainvivens TaxID=1202724 RepID=A0A0N0RQD6_9FLAO|nr:YdeI/OmpD-associated family protein [Flavobacterium akiainvivens]KOS04930.1 hypothetical protein AM493_01925 [Flavobacterium akiainvivens]SFQ41954.1 Bacteriocin-protection, YdeI or OmpD-Associated [Flavobacterium akiainvivens]
MEKPLVDKEYQLERFPGKGGWTYITLPEIKKEKDAAFGWVKVKGTIDGHEIKSYNLMPMGGGRLFFPVKAEIRKAIKKEEGDYVHVTLYRDDSVYQVPEGLVVRLEEAGVYKLFLQRKKWEQRMCAEWIYAAKRPETTEERILRTIFRLQKRENIVR